MNHPESSPGPRHQQHQAGAALPERQRQEAQVGAGLPGLELSTPRFGGQNGARLIEISGSTPLR